MTIQINLQSEVCKCNQCNSILHDDDLILCEDQEGLHKGCPLCHTDNMLMELDDRANNELKKLAKEKG